MKNRFETKKFQLNTRLVRLLPLLLLVVLLGGFFIGFPSLSASTSKTVFVCF